MSPNYAERRGPCRPVVCAVCPWRGNRVQSEEGFGTCPHCQGKVQRPATMDARRNAKAKEDLARMVESR